MLHIVNMIKFPTKKSYPEALFYKEYVDKLYKTLNEINYKKILLITKTLKKAMINKNNIFVCGNGGSGSVANHFLCDFNKGIKKFQVTKN